MQNSETFTRKTLIFSEIQPKDEEVKAKTRKTPDARMYARVAAVAVAVVGVGTDALRKKCFSSLPQHALCRMNQIL